MKMQNLFTAVLILPIMGVMSLLTGCGGGGGTAPSLVRWPVFAPSGSVTTAGTFSDVDYTLNSGDGTVVSWSGLGTPQQQGNLVVFNHDANDRLTEVRINYVGGTLIWDSTAGDTLQLINEGLGMVDNSGNLIGAFANPEHPDLGWNYQTYGLWMDFGTTTLNLGTLSTGLPTDGANIPTTNSATFSGFSEGVHTVVGETPYLTQADVSAEVNFGSRTVALSTSNTQTMGLDGSSPQNANFLNFTGTLTYAPGNNYFSGSVSTTTPGFTGNAGGQFYGPAAEELGGTFELSDGGSEGYVGAFGAAR